MTTNKKSHTLTGEDLYRMYFAAFAEEGTGIDHWDDLSISEQDVWEAVADQVVLKSSFPAEY